MSDRAVVNLDDERGRDLAGLVLPTITYGLAVESDVRATDVESTAEGIGFLADGVPIRSALRGSFNVENCLAAFATARWLGIDDGAAAEAIASVRVVPGRVETVEAGQGFLVMVDYAHTPDSVENVLRAARSLTDGRADRGVGAGGDRDRVKRPRDGPRGHGERRPRGHHERQPSSEDPLQIIAEIAPGANAEQGRRRPFRRRAGPARRDPAAMEEASPGDAVVIAGKGTRRIKNSRIEGSRSTIERSPRKNCASKTRTLGRRSDRAPALGDRVGRPRDAPGIGRRRVLGRRRTHAPSDPEPVRRDRGRAP